MQNEFIDWQMLIKTAYHLGINPKELWGLTPWEFNAIIAPNISITTISKQDFENLKKQFPDGV